MEDGKRWCHAILAAQMYALSAAKFPILEANAALSMRNSSNGRNQTTASSVPSVAYQVTNLMAVTI